MHVPKVAAGQSCRIAGRARNDMSPGVLELREARKTSLYAALAASALRLPGKARASVRK